MWLTAHSSTASSSDINWAEILAVCANIAVVLVAVASLYIALLALRHQRDHDNRVIRHEQTMAEPYVQWKFGFSDDGFVEISLTNVGPGAARFVRSELVQHGKIFNKWTWQNIFDAVCQGATAETIDPMYTMPKTIFSNSTVTLMKIRIPGVPAKHLLRRFSEDIEIRYIYRSLFDQTEKVAQWLNLSTSSPNPGK